MKPLSTIALLLTLWVAVEGAKKKKKDVDVDVRQPPKINPVDILSPGEVFNRNQEILKE